MLMVRLVLSRHHVIIKARVECQACSPDSLVHQRAFRCHCAVDGVVRCDEEQHIELVENEQKDWGGSQGEGVEDQGVCLGAYPASQDCEGNEEASVWEA